MPQADTEAPASPTIPSSGSPTMPVLGQVIRLVARDGHSMLGVVVGASEDGRWMPAYPDGSVEMYVHDDDGEAAVVGSVWTLLASEVADGTWSWVAYDGPLPEPVCDLCGTRCGSVRQARECEAADWAAEEDRRAGVLL